MCKEEGMKKVRVKEGPLARLVRQPPGSFALSSGLLSTSRGGRYLEHVQLCGSFPSYLENAAETLIKRIRSRAPGPKKCPECGGDELHGAEHRFGCSRCRCEYCESKRKPPGPKKLEKLARESLFAPDDNEIRMVDLLNALVDAVTALQGKGEKA
jgi:hypothetical protein